MMNKEYIFKKLKQKYVYLEELGYEVVYLALQGSQNYNMDLYTDDYKSDIDCFAVILPSFDDFVCNKSPVSTTIVLDNDEHIGLKDIREMFNLYEKQNVQYLETLFTDYVIKNKKYKNVVDELFKLRDDIANINKYHLYMSIIGMSKQKSTALTHPYPSIKDKIDQYGYDGKQLHHQIRLNQFIENLENGLSFKQALTTFTDLRDVQCVRAKLNGNTLEDALALDEYYCKETYKYKQYVEDKGIEDNKETIAKLTEIKSTILKMWFTEQLQPVVNSYKLCPDHYKNVFVISDTHFGHSNIIEYEHRDRKMNINGTMEHDNKLIDNWNSVVKPDDLVIILGDFSFHKPERTMEILRQLRGDKVLVEGNHDCIYLENKKFDKSLFKAIYDYVETTYRGQKLCLMHYPIQEFKHKDKDVNCHVHLFGHIHSVPFEIPRHSFNVGADVNNFTPVKLEYAIAQALENKGGKINGR